MRGLLIAGWSAAAMLAIAAAAPAQTAGAGAMLAAAIAGARNGICPSDETQAALGRFTGVPRRMPPARVFDNLYMLGEESTTAWALTTSAGIILFDAMFHGNVEQTVIGGLRQLGLDPADIEYVIVTHAHNDHFGGAHFLQQEFGARIVMSVEDWEHMHSWPQRGEPAPFPLHDTAVRDGYTITLGDTTVRIVATPGHTPGTISLIFPVRDGDDMHLVGYWGASAVSFLEPEGILEYMSSADRFQRIDAGIDVPLTNHPGIDGSLLKLAALDSRAAGSPHPFVAGNDAFREWIGAIHDCAGEVLEQKLAAGD